MPSFVSVKSYGARGGALSLTATYTLSGTTFTDSTNNPFTSASVGMYLILYGVGVGGRSFAAKITAYTSASTVTLGLTAPNPSGKTNVYQLGWDDTAAIQAALNIGGGVDFVGDSYMWTSVVPVPGNVCWGYGCTVYKIPLVAFLGAPLTSSSTTITFAAPGYPYTGFTGGGSNFLTINDGAQVEQVIITGPVAQGATTAPIGYLGGSYSFATGSMVQVTTCALFDSSWLGVGSSDGVTWHSGFRAYGFTAYGEGGANGGTAYVGVGDGFHQNFVFLQQWRDIHIAECNINNFLNSGIELVATREVWISQNEFYNCGFSGAHQNTIYVTDESNSSGTVTNTDLFIHRNYFQNISASAINLQAANFVASVAYNASITNNIVNVSGTNAWTPISLELNGGTNPSVNIQQVLIEGNICLLG